MARETINGISVPIPGTGEPADFVGDLRQIATDLPASFGEQVETLATPAREAVDQLGTEQARAAIQLVGRLPLHPTPPVRSYSLTSGPSPIPSAVSIPYNSALVTMRDGTPEDNATFGYRVNGSNGADAGGMFSNEFDYDGADLLFRLRVSNASGPAILATVDGLALAPRPWFVTETGEVTPSGVTLVRCRMVMPFAARRRWRIYLGAGAAWQGMDIEPATTLTATTPQQTKAFMLGDSFVGSALDIPQQQAMCEYVGRELGWSMANLGQGGTSYTQDGPFSRKAYTDATRLSEAAALGCTYGIIFGTVNDDATNDAAAVETAAASVYSQLATLQPALQLIVVGPPPQHSTVPAARLQSRIGVRAAALAAPNVAAFIDPINGVWEKSDGTLRGNGVPWVTGSGYASTTGRNPDGNSDWVIGSDNVHPTRDGHRWFAHKIAQAVREILGY